MTNYIWVGRLPKVGFFFLFGIAYVLASYYIGFQLSEVQRHGAQDTARVPRASTVFHRSENSYKSLKIHNFTNIFKLSKT